MVNLLNRMVEDMNKTMIVVLVWSLFFLSICLYSTSVSSYMVPQCGYGTFDAWFSTDGINWSNTTVDDIILLRGEPFFIKTSMCTIEPLVRVGLMFIEPGETDPGGSTYEIIDNEISMFEPYLYGSIEKPFHTIYHIWSFKVKSDTRWVQATAPLNVYVQFDSLDSDFIDSDEISFTLVCPYISEEVYTYDTDHQGEFCDVSSKMIPNDAILFIGIAFFVVLLRWIRS